jgi:5-methylcytosine-specific restriction endonuclease McrA
MGCLALNASYEPLTIIPVRRALRLIIDKKAEALEVDNDRPFRSERSHIHVPRRFRRQVTNTFLFARDGYRCQYCGRERRELGYRESLTRDHLVPLSRGGGNDWKNVVTACSRCNLRKGNHLPEECGLKPLVDPHEPNHVQLIWAVRRVTPIQAKYIGTFYGEEILNALTTY